MIIIINPAVFNSTKKDELRAISDVIRCIYSLNSNYIWDTSNISDFDSSVINSKWAANYFSNDDKLQLKEFYKMMLSSNGYLTPIMKFFSSKLEIGGGKEEILPSVAYSILKEKSRLVLENDKNDLKFISAISIEMVRKKFVCGKEFNLKPIFEKVKNALLNKDLIGENAGGIGGVKNGLLGMEEKYGKEYVKYKSGTLFDSDKDPKGILIEGNQKRLIQFLKKKETIENILDEGTGVIRDGYGKDDYVVWHMLYKKTIENYIPLEKIKKDFPDLEKKINLLEKTCTQKELDFIDVRRKLGISDTTLLPNLFKKIQRSDFNERCSHHLNSVSFPKGKLDQITELENILLKLAKII